MKPPSSRLPGLDGLRALAVLCVLLAHVGSSAGCPDWAILDQLRRLFSGLFGVQVFFAISGFIITLLLVKERVRTGTVSLRDFWIRRAIRILPPAGAYLLFVHFLQAGGHASVPPETQWGSLLFYRNMMPYTPWFTEAQGFTAHYWTLSLEEQFYLLWPVLVWLLPLPALRRVAWAGVVLSVVMRLCVPWLPMGSARWLPMCLDGFMAGALVAFEMQSEAVRLWEACWRKRWWLMGCALLLTRLSTSAKAAWFEPLQPLSVALACMVWIGGLARGAEGIETRFLNSRPLVNLGLISYSVYLWQQVWLAPSLQWTAGKAPALGVFPLNILVCLACGTASYWLIEKPCQRLREWIFPRPLPAPATAVALEAC